MSDTTSRRGKPGWLQPSIILLGLGCVLIAAVAYQAHAAVRSHRATIHGLLQDYARTAAWNYRQQTESELGLVVEHLFHPLHDGPPDLVRRVAPPLERILHSPHSEVSCDYDELGELSDAVLYSLTGGPTHIVGRAVSAEDAASLHELIAHQARTGAFLRRSEGMVGVALSGRPVILAYSRQMAASDTLVYALLLDPELLSPALRRPLERGGILPTPLVGDIPTSELLALRVDVPAAGEVFRSSGAFPEEYAAEAAIGGGEGHLRASLGLWPDAAEHLVIGGLPRSRLPVLLALLFLAAGLLGVAFVQLRREHELAAMRASFVSSVSHELRTPLALQRVFLDTLRLGRAEDEGERTWALDNIDRETHRLTHLVENVLRFAQSEDGRLALDPTPIDLRREIAQIVSDYAPLAASEDANVTFNADEAPLIAPVDRDGLRQVLRNLVENAVKYGPPGQTVNVSVTRTDDRAVITVDDEGPGIPPDERETVWRPFERGQIALSSAKGGSGIGLSVVADIVRLHNGTAIIQEAPSGGARFRIELPTSQAGRGPEGDVHG